MLGDIHVPTCLAVVAKVHRTSVALRRSSVTTNVTALAGPSHRTILIQEVRKRTRVASLKQKGNTSMWFSLT